MGGEVAFDFHKNIARNCDNAVFPAVLNICTELFILKVYFKFSICVFT